MAAILELDEHLNKNFKVRCLFTQHLEILETCLSKLGCCASGRLLKAEGWLGNRCLKQRRRM